MEPFIGQIIMFGGNFAPRGWALCDGQLLAISSHSSLFSILGTTYGGDGRTTFGLPDLRGRVAIHPGNGPGLSPYRLGEKGGHETVTLTTAHIPAHNHKPQASSDIGDLQVPTDAVNADEGAGPFKLYTKSPNVHMMPTDNTGGGQAHNNIQPFECVNFIIALEGVYPSRN